jgi:PKHD-type hydroxylase
MTFAVPRDRKFVLDWRPRSGIECLYRQRFEGFLMLKIENLLSPEELARVLQITAEAGFESGTRSAGYRAVRIKNNVEIAAESDAAAEVGIIVLTAVERNADITREIIPAKASAPLISCYRAGMGFGEHHDEPFSLVEPRIRRDLSMTLFLSDPSEYDGGELVIQSEFGSSAIKMPRNGAVFYHAGKIHHVAKVTRGERLAVIGWFQSHIRNAEAREMVADSLTIARRLHELEPDEPQTNRAFKTWSNLMRY